MAAASGAAEPAAAEARSLAGSDAKPEEPDAQLALELLSAALSDWVSGQRVECARKLVQASEAVPIVEADGDDEAARFASVQARAVGLCVATAVLALLAEFPTRAVARALACVEEGEEEKAEAEAGAERNLPPPEATLSSAVETVWANALRDAEMLTTLPGVVDAARSLPDWVDTGKLSVKDGAAGAAASPARSARSSSPAKAAGESGRRTSPQRRAASTNIWDAEPAGAASPASPASVSRDVPEKDAVTVTCVARWLAAAVVAANDESAPAEAGLRVAADKGWAPAMYDLGEMMTVGEHGVAAAREEALELLLRAADAGHARAMSRVAELCALDVATESLFGAAAASGLTEGAGPSKEAAEPEAAAVRAWTWLQRAAASGESEACFRLGAFLADLSGWEAERLASAKGAEREKSAESQASKDKRQSKSGAAGKAVVGGRTPSKEASPARVDTVAATPPPPPKTDDARSSLKRRRRGPESAPGLSRDDSTTSLDSVGTEEGDARLAPILASSVTAASALLPAEVRRLRADAVSHFRRAAHAGHVEARTRYAWCLQTGWGLPRRDLRAAVEWLELASEGGDAVAMVQLGHILAVGLLHLDGADARARPAASADAPERSPSAAAEGAGGGARRGYGGRGSSGGKRARSRRAIDRAAQREEELERAAQCYLQAAEQGDVVGCYEFSLCLRDGKGVPAEPVAALSWLCEAAYADPFDSVAMASPLAHECRVKAQVMLADVMLTGSPAMPRDPSRAVALLREAMEASGGLPDAAYLLGVCLARGDGVPAPDVDAARDLLAFAAEAGHDVAAAMLHEDGGLEAIAEAADEERKAESTGSTVASSTHDASTGGAAGDATAASPPSERPLQREATKRTPPEATDRTGTPGSSKSEKGAQDKPEVEK